MASSYDIETLVEDAIVTLLKEEGLNAERWEDSRNVNLSTVIKVACASTEEESGTINTYLASRCQVDIAVFTSKKRDQIGKTANATRGLVRKIFADANIVSNLNAVGSQLQIYENGVYPQGSFDASDEANHGKGVTFTVVALTI